MGMDKVSAVTGPGAVHRLRPDDGEAVGLPTPMPLTDARRAVRGRPDGALIPHTAGPVPAEGGRCGGARRGGTGGGQRPAADPGALPAARTHGAHHPLW